MIVADESGQFLAGGLVNLRGPEMIVVDQLSQLATKFDWKKQLHKKRLKIAILPRRLAELTSIQQESFRENFNHLDTFGGFALLNLLEGKADAMIDPVKGQPWYEAVIWGMLAERLGLIVTDVLGQKINFSDILTASTAGLEVPRVQMMTSTNVGIHEELLQWYRAILN